MRRNTKGLTGLAVVLLIAVAIGIVAFPCVLGKVREKNREFEQYVTTQGPWGTEGTWESSDGNSYLVSEKESIEDDYATVTGYFKKSDTWEKFDLNCRGRMVYMTSADPNSNFDGHMKFDGTVLKISGIKSWYGREKPEITSFQYTHTDKSFEP